MKKMRVKLTFQEELLGTLPGDKEIFRNYIGSKAPDAEKLSEEVEAVGVDAAIDSRMTVFPKLEDGTPFLYDYQVKGFFKSAAQAMNYIGGEGKLPAYKKKIDMLVFVYDRKIPIRMPGGAIDTGDCQRPLRAQTAQGERISLACSETCPAGSTVEFTIKVLDDKMMPYVLDWLDYGQYNGIGQWRNSGKGKFTWEEV